MTQISQTCLEKKLARFPVRRICVIKPSALGDVVQSLPLLPALKERFPSSQIAWVINHQLSEIVAQHPDVDSIIPFYRSDILKTYSPLLRHLKKCRFDLVLDLQGLFRTGLMTFATRAPIRVGLETAREGSSLANHLLIPDTGKQVPAWQRYWRIAEAFGVGELKRKTILPSKLPKTSLLSRFEKPFIAVHPGAKWITKRWAPTQFAEIAARAAQSYNLNIAIVGTKEDSKLSDIFLKHFFKRHPNGHVLNLIGQTSLTELISVLKKAELLLTNDSGPMHIAAAVETPVVGIFTCTSPILSGPPGNQHALIATNVSCAGSYKKTCPHSGSAKMCCLTEINVENVWNRTNQLLSQIFNTQHQQDQKVA